MLRFRYRQETDGGIWTSEPFELATEHAVRQGVIAGFLSGQARWAIDAETGALIYGLDRSGKEMKTIPR